MTPWQNERWATTPANDGRNFAPAHRWAVVEARPLCFGRVKTGAGIGELVPGCREEFECRGCLFEGSTLRPSEISLAAALLRVYIREAYELREENDKLKSKLHRIERRPPSYPYDIDIECLGRKLEYYFEKTGMLSALVAASKQRIATLEAENAKLAGQVLRHPWVRLGTTDWCAGCGAMNHTRDGRTAITNHKPDCPVVLSERVVRGDA